jgi:hypothetical protein
LFRSFVGDSPVTMLVKIALYESFEAVFFDK